MNSLLGGGSQASNQTPEQIEALRKNRQEYMDYLTNQQTNIKAAVEKKEITPESGSAVLNVIKKAEDWLTKNPNADLNTVLANREGTNKEIQRILQTDMWKKIVFIITLYYPTTVKEAEQKKIIKPEIVPKLEAITSDLKSWYKKNKDTANPIDFAQQIQEWDKKQKEIIGDPSAEEYIRNKLQEAFRKSPEEVEKLRQQEEKKIIDIQDQNIDLAKGFQTAMSTATTVFWSFLFAFLCIMSGSFAANMAIGRPPAYRVLYFLYGAIPIFAPFVLLYTIYRRIKEGRLPMYAVLPLSVEPATTRLGRFLWYPFYYLPDQEAVDMFNKFQESLKKAATA